MLRLSHFLLSCRARLPRVASVAVCLAGIALAQNSSLTGTVKDAQEGAVSAAAVTLTDLEKQTTLKTVTNEEGSYEFPTAGLLFAKD